MKFTLSWLKEHLDTTASLQEITDTLTMVGLEIEGVDDRSKGLETFVTARVVEATQHPNADRLKLATVDLGDERITVVCGAPTVNAQGSAITRHGDFVFMNGSSRCHREAPRESTCSRTAARSTATSLPPKPSSTSGTARGSS